MAVGEMMGVLPEISYEDLEFYEKLSSGAFGAVYRALWKSMDCIVAVKKVLVLEREAHVLKDLRHKNIIQFYGAVTKAPNFCLITEYVPNGSLASYLHDPDNEPLDFSTILLWAIDIASGVNYLHHEAPVTIVHRDLKSSNVVLSEENVCKLCDFGTSKPITTTTEMTHAGTYPWMSPEIIRSEPVSTSTDTWSFGVILWELLTGQRPFDGLTGFRIAYMVAQEGERLQIPSTCPTEFAELIKSCWRDVPKERPIFTNILKRLHSMEEDEELCDETSDFLNKKDAWLQEIQMHCERLKLREQDLTEKEGKLKQKELMLKKQAEDLSTQQRQVAFLSKRSPSYDIRSWDQLDVTKWARNKLDKIGLESDFLEHLILTLDVNQINGQRLMLLTDNDLKNFGVPLLIRRQIMHELTVLDLDNQRLQNFPPLSHANKQLHSKQTTKGTAQLKFTLLFGIYYRDANRSAGWSDASVRWRWKIFMDVDDIECLDSPSLDPLDCIKDVTFLNKMPPYEVFKVYHAPFVIEDWISGVTCLDEGPTKPESAQINGFTHLEQQLHPDQISKQMSNGLSSNGTSNDLITPVWNKFRAQFDCIVNYSDAVSRPRNTKFTYSVRLPEHSPATPSTSGLSSNRSSSISSHRSCYMEGLLQEVPVELTVLLKRVTSKSPGSGGSLNSVGTSGPLASIVSPKVSDPCSVYGNTSSIMGNKKRPSPVETSGSTTPRRSVSSRGISHSQSSPSMSISSQLSTPLLPGSVWSQRTFEDAVSEYPSAASSKKSSIWADIAAGLRQSEDTAPYPPIRPSPSRLPSAPLHRLESVTEHPVGEDDPLVVFDLTAESSSIDEDDEEESLESLHDHTVSPIPQKLSPLLEKMGQHYSRQESKSSRGSTSTTRLSIDSNASTVQAQSIGSLVRVDDSKVVASAVGTDVCPKITQSPVAIDSVNNSTTLANNSYSSIVTGASNEANSSPIWRQLLNTGGAPSASKHLASKQYRNISPKVQPADQSQPFSNWQRPASRQIQCGSRSQLQSQSTIPQVQTIPQQAFSSPLPKVTSPPTSPNTELTYAQRLARGSDPPPNGNKEDSVFTEPHQPSSRGRSYDSYQRRRGAPLSRHPLNVRGGSGHRGVSEWRPAGPSLHGHGSRGRGRDESPQRPSTRGSGLSTSVHGGYGKWRWKKD